VLKVIILNKFSAIFILSLIFKLGLFLQFQCILCKK